MKKITIILMVFIVALNLVACGSTKSSRKKDNTKIPGELESDIEKEENIENNPFAFQLYDKVFKLKESTLEEVLEELSKHDDIAELEVYTVGGKKVGKKRSISLSDNIMKDLKEWDYYIEATEEKLNLGNNNDEWGQWDFIIDIWYDNEHEDADADARLQFSSHRRTLEGETNRCVGDITLYRVGVYMMDIYCRADKALPFYYLGLQAGSRYEGDFSYIENKVKDSMPEDATNLEITDKPHGTYKEHEPKTGDFQFKEVSYTYGYDNHPLVKIVNGIIKWNIE